MDAWKLVLGSLVRHGLGLLFAVLMTHGVISKGAASWFPMTELTIGIVGFICTVGASIWQKATARWKFLEMKTIPSTTAPGVAVAEVDARAKTIPGTVKLAELLANDPSAHAEGT